MKARKIKCETCGRTSDVAQHAKRGQIPGAAYSQRWVCASCLYLEDHPDAARIKRARKPKTPQEETLI